MQIYFKLSTKKLCYYYHYYFFRIKIKYQLLFLSFAFICFFVKIKRKLYLICRCGEIGRRSRLKIYREQSCTSSSLVTGIFLMGGYKNLIVRIRRRLSGRKAGGKLRNTTSISTFSSNFLSRKFTGIFELQNF